MTEGTKLKEPIKVLLVDHHTLFRQALRQILEVDPMIEVVGEAWNGAQAVDLARETQPDLVLLDVEMPLMG